MIFNFKTIYGTKLNMNKAIESKDKSEALWTRLTKNHQYHIYANNFRQLIEKLTKLMSQAKLAL